MKVHANAPLGPKGRLTMVRRVVEEEWSRAAAAEAAGVSESHVRQVGLALPLGAAAQCPHWMVMSFAALCRAGESRIRSLLADPDGVGGATPPGTA